tara:strand:- start:607 stop:762 length:156 start_codon:yes stop_codon:yes gene_type:complete
MKLISPNGKVSIEVPKANVETMLGMGWKEEAAQPKGKSKSSSNKQPKGEVK